MGTGRGLGHSLLATVGRHNADAIVEFKLRGGQLVETKIRRVNKELKKTGVTAKVTANEMTRAGRKTGQAIDHVSRKLDKGTAKANTFRGSLRQALSPAAIGGTVGKALVSGVAITAFFGTIVAALNLIRNTVQNITSLLTNATVTVANFQKTTLGLQALLASMFKFSGDVNENFIVAGGIADKIQRALIARNKESIASFEELQLSMQAALGAGLPKYTKNWKEAVDVVILLSNAIASVTVGQDRTRQLTQEIRDFLQGTLRPTSQLSKLIDNMVEGGLKKQLAVWRETGTLSKDLLDILPGFSAATARFGRTLEGIKTTFQSIWQVAQIEIFGPVLREIGEATADLADKIQKPGSPVARSIANMTRKLSAGLLAGWDNFARVVSGENSVEGIFYNLEESISRLAENLPALGAAVGEAVNQLIAALKDIIALLTEGRLIAAVVTYMSTLVSLIGKEIIIQLGRDVGLAIKAGIAEASLNPFAGGSDFTDSAIAQTLIPPLSFFDKLRDITNILIEARNAPPLTGAALDRAVASFPGVDPKTVTAAQRELIAEIGPEYAALSDAFLRGIGIEKGSLLSAVDNMEDSVSLWDRLSAITDKYIESQQKLIDEAGKKWDHMYQGVETADTVLTKLTQRLKNLTIKERQNLIKEAGRGQSDRFFVTPERNFIPFYGPQREGEEPLDAVPFSVTDIETVNEGMARLLRLLTEANAEGKKFEHEDIAKFVKEITDRAQLVYFRKMVKERERIIKTYDLELKLRERQVKKDIAFTDSLLKAQVVKVSGLNKALTVEEKVSLERERQEEITRKHVLAMIRAEHSAETIRGTENQRTREMERQLGLLTAQLKLEEGLRQSRQIIRRFRLEKEGVVTGSRRVGFEGLVGERSRLEGLKGLARTPDDMEAISTALVAVNSEMENLILNATSVTDIIQSIMVKAFYDWVLSLKEVNSALKDVNSTLNDPAGINSEETGSVADNATASMSGFVEMIQAQALPLIAGFGQAFANAMQGLITGQQSFGQAIGGMIIAIGNLAIAMGTVAIIAGAFGIFPYNKSHVAGGIKLVAIGAGLIALGHAMNGGGATAASSAGGGGGPAETPSFSFNQAMINSQQGAYGQNDAAAMALAQFSTLPAGVVVKKGGKEAGGFLPIVAKEASTGSQAGANQQLAKSLQGKP